MKNEIKLAQDPYICGPVDAPYYEAAAIDLDGDPDSPAYVVRWKTRDDFDPSSDVDESSACDWGEFVVFAGGRYVGDGKKVIVRDPRGAKLNEK